MTRTSAFQLAFAAGIVITGTGAMRDEERLLTTPPKANYPPAKVEQALNRAAERFYVEKRYPKAADAYRELLRRRPAGRYRKQAIDRLYAIGRHWLQDSWEQVRLTQQWRNEPDWLLWIYPHDVLSDVLPRPEALVRGALACRHLFHWDETKPFFNEEGRAAELLKLVYDTDPDGPLADKSLLLLGHVAWYREDYQLADEWFSRLEEGYPDSPYSPYALELAVKAKLMSFDAAEGPCRLVEARRLIKKALDQPDYSWERKNDLIKLLGSIYIGLADWDLKQAEEHQLAGRIQEAIDQYEFVRMEYPGTLAADQARERAELLRRNQANTIRSP